MILLDKPAGMPSQPTRFTERGTATAWALDHLLRQGRKGACSVTPDQAGERGSGPVRKAPRRGDAGASLRRGNAADGPETPPPATERGRRTGPIPFVAPAHRLDAPTSGVLCLCIDRASAGALQKQFQTHSASRIYLAIVEGSFALEETTLVHHLELDRKRSFARVSPKGREARTRVRVLSATPEKSLLMLAPETGLTHQIRLQLSATGHPVLGDSRYGKGGAARLALHASALSLKHPHTGRSLHFEAPPGEDFWALWEKAVYVPGG